MWISAGGMSAERHVDRVDAVARDAAAGVHAQRHVAELGDGVHRERLTAVGVAVALLAGRIEVEQRRDRDDARRLPPALVEHRAGDAEREVAAGRVAGDRDVLGGIALLEQPAETVDTIGDGLGDRLVGHLAVADVEHGLLGAVGDAGHEPAMRVEAARDERAAVEVEDGSRVATADVGDALGLEPFAVAVGEIDRAPHRALVDGEQPGHVLDDVRREDVEGQPGPRPEQGAYGVAQPEAEKPGLDACSTEELWLSGQ